MLADEPWPLIERERERCAHGWRERGAEVGAFAKLGRHFSEQLREFDWCLQLYALSNAGLALLQLYIQPTLESFSA